MLSMNGPKKIKILIYVPKMNGSHMGLEWHNDISMDRWKLKDIKKILDELLFL